MKLLQKIRTAEVKVGVSKNKSAWYRGHSNQTWTLAPKLLRSGHSKEYIYRAENASYADFRGSARRYIETSLMHDSWDYLAAMQHFGIATRLLDWTTELDIALYFAIASVKYVKMEDPDQWPCIWVLNPYRLNELYAGESVIFDRADPIPFDYYASTIECIRSNKRWPNEAPIAFNPGFSNSRLQAQHGCFTVHGENLAPMGCGQNPSENFWELEKVSIDPNDWGQLKRSSVRDAAAHLRIYPDIEGYAKFLNHKMKA